MSDNSRLETGFHAYQTHDDGLCCFNTMCEAVAAAEQAARREGERITVWSPDGEHCRFVGRLLPTHRDTKTNP